MAMQTEAKKMVDFLMAEAADFERILTEIAEILGDQNHEPVKVEEVIREWLASSVARGGMQGVSFEASGLAIDLAPMLGAIAAEIALHIKGALIPVIGTAISIALAYWRQLATVEKIKTGMAEGLRKSLKDVPNAEQRGRIDRQFVRAVEGSGAP